MKVLIGYNGSTEAVAAVELAAKYAKLFGGEVILMTSTEGGGRESADEIHEAQARLNDAQADMEKNQIPCKVVQTARGISPGEDIVRFANENTVELIVVGIEKKSRTRKLLLGSTAQYVILRAPCPVLTVK